MAKQGQQPPDLDVGAGQSVRRNAADTGFEAFTPGAGGAAAWGDITGTLSNQTDLQGALNAKEAAANKGATSGYAGLDAASKVPTVNLGGAGADNTKYLRGDQTWVAPGGGSDPWTYLTLAADFTTTSATAVDVTGLGFAPTANIKYEFEAMLMIRTATATVNPRAGLAWPTGMTDGMAMIEESQAAATVPIVANGNIAAALLIAVGGLPNTTQSWPVRVQGMVVAGATPSGNVRIQLASETAGTTVRIVAGSFLKYRSYA